MTATVTIDGEGSEVSGFLPFTYPGAGDLHKSWPKRKLKKDRNRKIKLCPRFSEYRFIGQIFLFPCIKDFWSTFVFECEDIRPSKL